MIKNFIFHKLPIPSVLSISSSFELYFPFLIQLKSNNNFPVKTDFGFSFSFGRNFMIKEPLIFMDFYQSPFQALHCSVCKTKHIIHPFFLENKTISILSFKNPSNSTCKAFSISIGFMLFITSNIVFYVRYCWVPKIGIHQTKPATTDFHSVWAFQYFWCLV